MAGTGPYTVAQGANNSSTVYHPIAWPAGLGRMLSSVLETCIPVSWDIASQSISLGRPVFDPRQQADHRLSTDTDVPPDRQKQEQRNCGLYSGPHAHLLS